MFGNIIKAEDLTFLEQDNYRIMFKRMVVSSIAKLANDFKEKYYLIDCPGDKPFGSILINYDIHKISYPFCIKLDYNNLELDITASPNKLLERMFRILKEMNLIFKIRSNSEGINSEYDYDYSLCTFSKTENRKMFNNGLSLPFYKKKEILVDTLLHANIALLIYDMFGDIANELAKFNNGHPVEIFYGDINFAFKDWLE